jgi:hypothetical protein
MVVRALKEDRSPKSDWLRHSGLMVLPQEACLDRPDGWLWVRASGRWVSGWWSKDDYVSCHFGLIDAWRIRRAVTRWGRRLALSTSKALNQ